MFNSLKLLFIFLLHVLVVLFIFFFFNDTAPTEIYTLSLHDALPISWLLASDAGYERGAHQRGLSGQRARRPSHEDEWDEYADRGDGSCSRRKPARHTDLARGAKGCRDIARRLVGGLWPWPSPPPFRYFPG